jgi:hypothetical protein
MFGLASSYCKANRMNITARWSFQLQDEQRGIDVSSMHKVLSAHVDLMDSGRIVGNSEVERQGRGGRSNFRIADYTAKCIHKRTRALWVRFTGTPAQWRITSNESGVGSPLEADTRSRLKSLRETTRVTISRLNSSPCDGSARRICSAEVTNDHSD